VANTGKGEILAFNSPVFLFLFLPLIFVLYYAVPKKSKNLLLLAASILFYAWADAYSLRVLIFSIAVNYAFGLIIERTRAPKLGAAVLGLVLSVNIALLLFYKYSKFAIVNLGSFGIVNPDHFDFTGWRLPLGISFFTFAAIAYQVDIYRKKVRAEKNLIDYGLFLSHFAKLVAGPIVRYGDMAEELKKRHPKLENLEAGVRRFVVGLAKKVLVANPAALFVDALFNDVRGLDMPTAWLGIVFYTIQIYFDFSGYTDMAIGLGRMFGFEFMENFNYPYISRSIQEFWRRWHISLSTWFRDYLYIPLGGNRVSKPRIYCNLVLVFLLCGLWHGASWNYIVWGGYHGVFLAAERAGLGGAIERLWKPLRHLYAVVVIMIGWVFFRADDLPQALQYLRVMFSFSCKSIEYYNMTFLNKQLLLVLIVGIVASTPVVTLLKRLQERIGAGDHGSVRSFWYINWSILTTAVMLFLFIASAMQVAITTYTPFIYAKF
jgi:alginate O-acetyltransferase complex protein AlgI